VQFGHPIGSFQAVKHQLADMHIETQLAETAVLWASLEPAEAHRPVRFAVDAAIRVAQDAIQVHGAMGFTWELGLHYYLRSMLVRREMLQCSLAGGQIT
jgi:alkylation response protein AidB-like acyl-CoA dehydrogenase